MIQYIKYGLFKVLEWSLFGFKMGAEWALMNKSYEMFVVNGLKLTTFEPYAEQKTDPF